jgi:hypothetical protein
MAKSQPKSIEITKQPGQISAPGGELSNYLVRQMPIWNNPNWLHADVWRAFVAKQPIAVLCREAISSYLLSLDWAIVSREADKQDEYKEDIKHYTKLFERGNAYYNDIDFSTHVEWLVKDLFDLPFGGASEIGREYDKEDGKVVWIRPLDAATLAPTLNIDFPVVQHFPNYQPVVFPRAFISRSYLSPRTEIRREGWGMAPPEKIYLAMDMVSKGDIYYYQLLLNTPEAGILDLKDMTKESATEWVNSFRDMLYGINPLKVPVLYEHTEKAEWIPFGKLPSEILYDSVTARYITIITAGYGLSPSDIGFASSSNGGETLAGTIRQERRSAKSGKALAKTKLKAYFERILPDHLEFKWIDFDDERNVAMSRARMASASAFKTFTDMQAFSPDEVRSQAIADGLFTISLPETIDRTKIEWPSNTLRYVGNKSSNPEGGDPKKSPSTGGQGETIPQQVISRNRAKIEVSISKAVYSSNQFLGSLLESVKSGNNDVRKWEDSFDGAVIGKSQADMITESVISDTYNSILDVLDRADWVDTVSSDVATLLSNSSNDQARATTLEYLTSRAEEEFIAGTRDSLALSEEELAGVNGGVTKLSLVDVKRALLGELIPKVILVSKSTIMDYKYPINTKDVSDSSNLKLAREIAEKVYHLLPTVVEEVRKSIKLGEN